MRHAQRVNTRKACRHDRYSSRSDSRNGAVTYLENARRGQQHLNVLLVDDDSRRVAEFDEQLHGVLVDVVDDDFRLSTLGQFTSEHCFEVGTAGYAKDARVRSKGVAERRCERYRRGRLGGQEFDFVR